MASKRPDREATLSEVLNEVSLVDLGRMLKRGLAALGCWALFSVIILVVTSVTGTAGVGWDKLGIPSWTIWLLFGWMYVYGATSERSFHELKLSWYFPKLGWFTSLLLTGYFVGFAYLLSALWQMPQGIERGAAFFAVWFGYTAPFVSFCSVVNAGYEKLMAKREEALAEPQDGSEAVAW